MSPALRIALAGTALGLAWLSPASAGADAPAANACVRHAPEAAARSGLPVDVILRVMQAESRGRPRAISPKGAMGCMQIMPQTWVYLSSRYGLGSDPFEPRMNMIGGAFYLAELARQFGFPGAYSAYNAGPGRYLRYVRDGVPLPGETVAYAGRIAGGVPTPTQPVATDQPPAPRWQEASLFLVRPASPNDTDRAPRTASAGTGRPASGLFPLERPSDTR
jgi:soluble lytic murein transglycosylase-like protein